MLPRRALSCGEASAMQVEEVREHLDVDLDRGLTSLETSRRRDIHGFNEVAVSEPDPLWKKYLDQFNNPLIYLLLGSALISILMGQYDDAASITFAVIIVVTVGFVQEYRSEKTLERLGALLPPACTVVRDGAVINTLAKNLVPGDVVHLQTGDRIPADLRLFKVSELSVDESSLTGEPIAKPKDISATAAAASSSNAVSDISEMDNICFQGTLVTDGNGSGMVVCTGENSQFGEIFKKMQSEEPPRSPLQKSMDTLGKQLSAYSLTVIGLIMALGCWQGRNVLDMFNVGVSLAVAAIPEGLPVVVTVTLAFGVMRMANRKAIIKRLPTVEALGCLDVICSDKTGTLTMNDMSVGGYQTAGAICSNIGGGGDQLKDVSTLIETGVVCNNAADGGGGGSATEKALLAFGAKNGLDGSVMRSKTYNRVGEIPFSSERKYMAVQCVKSSDGSTVYFMKGAVEEVVTKCQFYLSNGVPQELNNGARQAVSRASQDMGSRGLRVVGMAKGTDKDSMAFAGIVGLQDPLRPGVCESVQMLQASKVQVCMITGDGRETAQEIARSLGILSRGGAEEEGRGEGGQESFAAPATKVMLSGSELDAMSDTQLTEVAESVGVYYRVSPLHKLRIVKALQRTGHVVGMTGDGVNDGVAIKCADVGIAMGKNGTDVCKEAADVILLDDDFSTILSAIEEGKSIFYNIRNFVCFQLSTSVAALTLIALSTLLDVPNPLNPMQILWINVIMDGPPAQSLGLEPVDHNVLRKPPRKAQEQILTRSLMTNIVTSAFFITTGTMWVLKSTMEDGKVTARDTTMTFTTFVFFDMFNALSSRSQDRSIFEVGFTTNRVFCVAVGLSVIGQLLVIYFPPLQYIFQTEALALSDLIFLVALSSSVFIAAEVRKAYFNSSQSGSTSRAMSKFSLKSKLIDLKGRRSSSPPTPFIKSSFKKKGSEHMV